MTAVNPAAPLPPAPAGAAPGTRSSAWGGRVRFCAAVLALWFVLQYGVQAYLMPPGLAQPRMLVAAGGVAAIPAVVLLVLGAALLHRVVSGTGQPSTGIGILCLAIVLWIAPGGTMDDWLARSNPRLSAPTAAAFVPLIGELVFWIALLGIALSLLLRGAALPSTDLASPKSAADALRRGPGLSALGAVSALGAAFVLILSGPPEAKTYRGQVWFAVFVGFYAATYFARMLTNVGAHLVYWAGPAIVALGALIWALLRPAPGGIYAPHNLLVPNGILRALPAETLCLGLLGVIWALRTPHVTRHG